MKYIKETIKQEINKQINEGLIDLYLQPKITKLQKLPPEQKLKLLYEWTKTGVINFKEFIALIPIAMQ